MYISFSIRNWHATHNCFNFIRVCIIQLLFAYIHPTGCKLFHRGHKNLTQSLANSAIAEVICVIKSNVFL